MGQLPKASTENENLSSSCHCATFRSSYFDLKKIPLKYSNFYNFWLVSKAGLFFIFFVNKKIIIFSPINIQSRGLLPFLEKKIPIDCTYEWKIKLVSVTYVLICNLALPFYFENCLTDSFKLTQIFALNYLIIFFMIFL